MLCCGYTLTDFPISIRLTSLALGQSNDCPSASKATLMNMDKYFMWIHYERLHNHNKAKHNKTVCIFLGIYCTIQQNWIQSAVYIGCLSTPYHLQTWFYFQIQGSVSPNFLFTSLLSVMKTLHLRNWILWQKEFRVRYTDEWSWYRWFQLFFVSSPMRAWY